VALARYGPRSSVVITHNELRQDNGIVVECHRLRPRTVHPASVPGMMAVALTRPSRPI